MLQDTVVQDTGRNSPNQNDIDAQRDENEEVEEEERRETGTVKFAVYKTYWKVKYTQNASCFVSNPHSTGPYCDWMETVAGKYCR